MTTLFPGAIDSFSTKVDSVTDVLAAHINDVQDSIVAIETAVIAQSPNPNILYHTISHDIWPEGVTFNDVADDTYLAGLWNALHNGQPPDVTGEAAVIDGSKRAIRCTFDSASSQAGFIQFLGNEDTVPLIGKTLSFSIDCLTLNVANMRCAILEWVGTADTVTSDVVTTWQTGNPVLATSWSYIGTPASQAISGTTRIKAEGKVIGATTTNLAVFVWTPDLEASTDYVRLANAKLEIGLTATDFVSSGLTQERHQVEQFYQKTYDPAVVPGTITVLGSQNFSTRKAIAGSAAGNILFSTIFRTPMYKVPTVVIYSGATTGTINAIRNSTASTDRTGSTAGDPSTNGFRYIAVDNASANAIALDDALVYHWVADARL